MQALIRNVVALVTCHWLVMTGVAVTTGSGVALVTLSLLSFTNPYYGIILFLVLPGVFSAGLALIPLGVYLRSRQVGGFRQIAGQFTWKDNAVGRLLFLLTGATVLNIVLLSTAAYEGREYLDSDAFCGTVCHDVMGPQYTRYLESSHAQAGCVSCHIAPGVSWAVYHKLAGVRQVLARASGTYPRPIPSSGGRLHPAEATCGGCHRMDVPAARPETLRVIRSFGRDEESTPTYTVLLMHVQKIHAAHAESRIEYVAADDALQTIPSVSVDGTAYRIADAEGGPEGESRPGGEDRTMDCTDCHNRVGHDFPTLETTVDRALVSGILDRDEPFAKRDALSVLGTEPLSGASQAEQNIYADHVFPDMDVTWGAYPNNIGHEKFPGCFRCHDFDHESENGDTLFLGCTTCHSLTAMEEEAPEVLDSLGL